ncbi:histidine kinase, partial [Streptomyces bambusae]|nr:histidine kinase [Streptomyces bambusae]
MRRLLGARARRRWVHLILGGALLMPYFLLASVLLSPLTEGKSAFTSLPLTLAAYGIAVPLAAVSAPLFTLVRPLSVTAVRTLCGVPGEQLAEGPARSPAARGRAAAWWTLHLGVGAVVSGMTLAVPPMALVLFTLPVVGPGARARLGMDWFASGAAVYAAPLAGALLLAALAQCAAVAGALGPPVLTVPLLPAQRSIP